MNTQPLKTTWTGVGPFGPLCREVNRISRMLNNLQIITGGTVDVSSEYIKLYCEGGSGTGDFPFQITLGTAVYEDEAKTTLAGYDCTMNGGTLRTIDTGAVENCSLDRDMTFGLDVTKDRTFLELGGYIYLKFQYGVGWAESGEGGTAGRQYIWTSQNNPLPAEGSEDYQNYDFIIIAYLYDDSANGVLLQQHLCEARARNWPSGAFTGYVYSAGKMYDLTGETPKAYVYVPFDGTTPTYEDAYVDQDPNGEYFRVAGTSGDIHVSRD